jgi:rhodanese-related sulfurtransferase
VRLHKLKIVLLALALSLPAQAGAVDPGALPEIKRTKLGLYLEAREVPEFLKRHAPKVLFVDVRTAEEQLFDGVPEGIDGATSFGIMNYGKWDEKKNTYLRYPNPDFLGQFEMWALDKGIDKNDPIVLICRSGDRSALSTDLLARYGYTNVWSVVDGFEGDLAKDGPRKGQRAVNGWKNAGLPWTFTLDRKKVYMRE